LDIAITGAGGFIGRALSQSLNADGHRVIEVTRSAARGNQLHWDPQASSIDASGLEGIHAVVHLAGEPIAARPWTKAQRARIADSRRKGTTLLATTLAGLADPPATLISGSAIGFYGERGDTILSEHAEPGTDFLAEVCTAWEHATVPARDAGIRVCHLRTGIVLDQGGGALAKMITPFRFGLGGKAGKGQAWMSWISLRDEVRAIRFALDTATLNGPLNLTAPNPVRNVDFTAALGAALHKPTRLSIPSAIRHVPLGVGDLFDNLLFTSIRAVPKALTDSGFRFEHETIDSALAAATAKD